MDNESCNKSTTDIECRKKSATDTECSEKSVADIESSEDTIVDVKSRVEAAMYVEESKEAAMGDFINTNDSWRRLTCSPTTASFVMHSASSQINIFYNSNTIYYIYIHVLQATHLDL